MVYLKSWNMKGNIQSLIAASKFGHISINLSVTFLFSTQEMVQTNEGNVTEPVMH